MLNSERRFMKPPHARLSTSVLRLALFAAVPVLGLTGMTAGAAPDNAALANPATNSVTLSWDAPAVAADASKRALAGYRVYYGTSPYAYNARQDIPDPAAVTCTLTNLPAGTYYFAVSSYDTAGRESPCTAPVVKTLGVPPPAEPFERGAPSPPAAPPAGPAPRIVCREPVFDFGRSNNLDDIEHAFLIENDGDAPLLIKRVRGTCGCAETRISCTNIPPGETATLHATFVLKGRVGTQTFRTHLQSNDPVQPYYTLTTRGTADADILVNPPFLMLDTVLEDQTAARSVELVPRTNFTFAVTGACVKAEWLAARYEPLAGQPGYTLTLQTVPPLPLGYASGTVEVCTDHPRQPVWEVPYRLYVKGELVVAPDAIHLRAGGTNPVSRTVSVRSGTLATFEVLSVEAPEPGIEVRIEPYSPGYYIVVLRNILPSPALGGKSVKIVTTATRMQEILVPFRVTEEADSPRGADPPRTER
ncbi:MAG: DUF1573 domain-containing protein [Kiritimatiellae bacterium]|nr:DUF1573 domain-containing protein [Kiritimatiellia bacterium]